jgi:signal transduction histidine kinase
VKTRAPSFVELIQSKIRKWVIGALLASLFIALCLSVFMAKSNYEQTVINQAKAATMSFRTQILEGSSRFVEDQLRLLYSLHSDERVYLLDKDRGRIYRPQEAKALLSCEPLKACWDMKSHSVVSLAPVAFDEGGQNIYGYVYLSRQINPDLTQFIVLALSIFAGVSLLIYGVSSSTKRLSETLAKTLGDWANQIKTNPKEVFQSHSQNPIRELEPLRDALLGLNRQISDFESKAEYNAKLRLVRSVAHDLATPISQMDKYLFVLKAQLKNGAPNISLLDDVGRSLARLKNLSSQTKDLSRVELASKVSKIDLANEVPQVIDDLRDSFEAGNKQINLSYDSNGLNHAYVKADPLQIDRLISNLVKNAFHASSPDSKIAVSLLKSGNETVLAVKDHGHGIAPENLNKIFEPDFTTRPATGTGLGLSIVKEICDSLSAQISVQSVEGQGTEFTIKFKSIDLAGGIHESQNFVG